MTKSEIIKQIEKIQRELTQLKRSIKEAEQYSVYYHLLPNGKYYIGIAKDTDKRWLNGEGYRANTEFYNAINKYKWSNIQHKIIHKFNTQREAEQLETFLIFIYNASDNRFGYNKRNLIGNIGTNEEKRKKEIRRILTFININIQELASLEEAYQNRKGE